jgi:hypothetical protein
MRKESGINDFAPDYFLNFMQIMCFFLSQQIVPTMSFEFIKGQIELKWKQEIEAKIAAVRF